MSKAASQKSFFAYLVLVFLWTVPCTAETLFELGSRMDEAAVVGASEERLIDLDLASLTTKAAYLDIPLAPGVPHRATLVEVEERTPSRFTWRGRIATPEDSELLVNVTLTVHDGLLFGALTLPSGTWVIQPVKEGGYRLAKMDASLFPSCGGGILPQGSTFEDSIEPAVDASFQESGNSAAEGEKATSFIAVLGLYTPQARNGAGSQSAMEGTFQNAIDSTNTAFINSQVQARVVLRHVREFSGIPEIGNINTSLAELRVNDTVAALRDQWGADLVAAVFERDSEACGWGYVMRNPSRGFAPWGFSTNLRTCIASQFTLAHELGHNMGLEHDPGGTDATPDVASYPWSFGHSVDGKFRTIMSTFRQCPQRCTRRLHFSNPAVRTLGESTGIANQRDNHRSLNLTTPIVARFRDVEVVTLEADFEVEQGSPRRTAPVHFLNRSRGTPTEIRWDFGDGNTSSEESPTHTYSQVGAYTVRLEITNGSRQSNTSQEITVLDNLCTPGVHTLCLGADGRFEATVRWQNFEDETGQGTVVASEAEDSGLLWFFDDANWEMLIKVVNGCGFNNKFWVFSAATTNVEYTLEVIDTRSGDVQSYFNPLGNAAAALTDNGAFETCHIDSAPLTQPEGSSRSPSLHEVQRGTASDTCGSGEFCLAGDRFRVEVDWVDFDGNMGTGSPATLRSDDSGLFWFFNENNWEMLVKVVNGCGFNDHFWVFSAATTNLAYNLRVTDLETGITRLYPNELGTAAPALTDNKAFATCP